MRAISTLPAAAALVGALLLSGCGSDKPKPKPAPPAEAAPTSGTAQPSQPPPPAKDSGPMIPGDPGTAVKVLNRGKDAARKLEDQSRETAGGADDSDEGK